MTENAMRVQSSYKNIIPHSSAWKTWLPLPDSANTIFQGFSRNITRCPCLNILHPCGYHAQRNSWRIRTCPLWMLRCSRGFPVCRLLTERLNRSITARRPSSGRCLIIFPDRNCKVCLYKHANTWYIENIKDSRPQGELTIMMRRKTTRSLAKVSGWFFYVDYLQNINMNVSNANRNRPKVIISWKSK